MFVFVLTIAMPYIKLYINIENEPQSEFHLSLN